MSENKKNSIPNIWTAQESVIHFYRMLCIGLGAFLTLVMIVTCFMLFRDPVVVLQGSGRHQYYPSKRAKVTIERADVEEFIQRYLESVYVWPEFNESSMAKEIAPYSEDSLVEKIVGAQSAKFGKALREKKLEQSIAFVKINVLADRVTARFLRVLLIEGIPLTIPTDITLSLIQGRANRMNPVGIFVSGMVEHEGAK